VTYETIVGKIIGTMDRRKKERGKKMKNSEKEKTKEKQNN
jgi:hypothetical protein